MTTCRAVDYVSIYNLCTWNPPPPKKNACAAVDEYIHSNTLTSIGSIFYAVLTDYHVNIVEISLFLIMSWVRGDSSDNSNVSH